MKYRKIFEPLTIKHMEMKNRIMMCPMGTNYGEQNGEISNSHIMYYEQRAKGGTGLIMVENASVKSPEGSNGTTQLRIDHDSYIPKLFLLTEAAHRHGACIGIQINHAGASAMSSRTGMQPVSSSDVPSKDGGEIPRPLSKEEIEEIAVKYGEAARRAKAAGFDTVEIHAGHSYLISQFLSPVYNKREDEFGGSFENRCRFLNLVLDEVRKQVGNDFPIFVRLSAEEFVEGGNTLSDTLEYIKYFDDKVDAYDVSAALNASIQYQIDANYLKDGWRSYMAKAVKERYGKPCVTMGNIRNPEAAEEILERGDADIIGIGRGLIADPEWANKAEEGRCEDIRKCISCNIGCAGNRIGINRPIRCTVNPSVIEGETHRNRKVVRQCNVVVVGGGTAGLEAACTAAETGCNAFIIEKEKELGGLAGKISGNIPDKARLGDFPSYLKVRAQKLKNLYAFTGTEATMDMVKGLKPDIVVNATGSSPLLPNIKGLYENIDMPGGRVFSIIHLMENIGFFPEDMKGKKITVIGGGAVGLDVVEFFAPKGADITIVEMLDSVGNGIDPVSKVDFATLFEKYGVKQMTKTKLQEVRKDTFIVSDSEGTIELKFDYGFICMGMKAAHPVLEELKEAFEGTDTEVINIGDSKRARRIIEGTMEGRNIVNTLIKKGFLQN